METINRIQRLPAKIVQTIRCRYGVVFGHSDYDRFAVIGNARTGSNFLLDGITSSRSVFMFHEIFADHNRIIGTNFNHIISKLYQKKEDHIKHVGVKIFYYHLTEDEWTKFCMHDEFKIIHLVRLNRLRTIVSLEIALKTNQWVATPSSKNDNMDKSITINTTDLVEKIEKIGEYEEKTRELFKERQFLEVTYEDLTTHPLEEFKKIKDFLNLSTINPNSIKHKKQNPESLKKLITNYDEVSQVLIGTRYVTYLNSNFTF